jgi:hypothetical protein
MAGVKISELPSATTPLAGTELIAIVQSGITSKVAASAVGGGGPSLLAVASHILPAAGATYNIGGLSLSFKNGYFGALLRNNGATIFDIDNQRINSADGNPSIYSDSRQLRTGTHGAPVIKFDWTSNPVLLNSTGVTMLYTGASALTFNMNFLPNGVGTLNVGSPSLPLLNMYSQFGGCISYLVRSSNYLSELGTLSGSPLEQHSGVTTLVTLKSSAVNGAELGIFTENNATANATATDGIYIGTGNKTAGTGDSGNIRVVAGTSAGGARGSAQVDALFLVIPRAAGDPATGIDGAMYYNTATDKFMGYANGAWVALH